ncbi:MAG TPA: ATP-binding protein [Methylomirabilota bacterium]
MLSEAVSLVVGHVADELSNPLTNLVSRLELMLAEAGERGEQGVPVDDLDALHRSARRLVRIVETIRAYSSDGAVGVRPVRLNEIVSSAHAAANLSGSTLILDPGDPLILADPARLQGLVAGVLAAAGRASTNGDGPRVETKPADGDASHVVLEISGVDGVAELIAAGSRLASEHAGTLEVRPVQACLVLALTFPQVTLRLPSLARGGEGLRRIVRELAEACDVSELAQRITESVLPLFRMHSASAWLRQLDGSLACVARAGRAESLNVRDGLPHDGGDAERRVLWAAAVIEATAVVRADEPGNGSGAGLHAVVAVPLVVKGEVIGAIVMRPAKPGGLVQAELDLVQAFADQVAPAMHNAQLVMHAETARAAAEAANLAKDESLVMLAHEFRNSLAPIMTSAALIRRVGPPSGVVHDSADIVKRQARHLARLLDDLLDVSRIARGGLELRREPVPLGTVLEQAVETARRDADPLGLTITLSPPPGPLWIDADPTRLEQVVANLLGNAVKYTGPGGRIEVTAGAEDGEAVLRVQDTGIGIPPELLPRVFEPFFRSPRAQEHTPAGLGIGLTLVRQLVELHGGRVAAHSEGPGRGSAFTVRLPLGAGASPLAPVAAAVSYPRAPCDVLIVEDHADTRETLSALLAHEGYRVHVAGDGPSGLAQDEAIRPCVVLVDIDLPGLKGHEVASRIRARRGAEPLLVAVTGLGRPEDRHRSFEAGFDAHLTKPVLSDDLLRVLGALEALAGRATGPRRAD